MVFITTVKDILGLLFTRMVTEVLSFVSETHKSQVSFTAALSTNLCNLCQL